MSQPIRIEQSIASDDSRTLAYLVVVAGICAALHVWKLPPALPVLQQELGFTLVQSGFLMSFVQLAGMSLGLASGLLAEKIGLRRCMLTGLALLVIASASSALLNTAFALLFFRAVEGIGFLLVVMPAPGLIKRLVPAAYLSRVLGLWGSYIPIGTVIVLIGGSWVLDIANWRVLWIVLALVTIAMAGLLWRFIPPDPHHHGAQSAASPRSSWLGLTRTTLGSQNVWLVALTFAVYAMQWVAVISFLPSIYAQAGISGTQAGFLTAIAGGSNVIGNIWAGRLSHKGVRPHVLLWIGFATMAVSSFCAFGLDIAAVYQFLGVVVFSAIGGFIPATLFLLALRVAPSPQTTSMTVGWLQQCSACGQFLGPPFVAWVVTMTGGWQWTWVVTSAFAMIGMVLAARLGRLTRP